MIAQSGHVVIKPVDKLALILPARCQMDKTETWHMVCGKCWRTVSGGVVDGDDAHPDYRCPATDTVKRTLAPAQLLNCAYTSSLTLREAC